MREEGHPVVANQPVSKVLRDGGIGTTTTPSSDTRRSSLIEYHQTTRSTESTVMHHR